MNGKNPHIVQYQGSKRTLAPQILQYIPQSFDRLIEPFSGMAAITIAVACEGRAKSFHINDLNKPIVDLLKAAVESPSDLIKKYTKIWEGQFDFGGGHIEHFYHVREMFNGGNQSPENMLYILARCVKGAVRYGKNGNFNQSLDKRRHGTNPKNIYRNVNAIASLLHGKTAFTSYDYRELFDIIKPGDFIYMDPPYQGVTNARDNRYFSGVDFEEFVNAIEKLNSKGVDYLISYDGECGGKEYGRELPQELNCTKILLNAGISTQSTLLGKRHTTYEALYVSKGVFSRIHALPKRLSLLKDAV